MPPLDDRQWLIQVSVPGTLGNFLSWPPKNTHWETRADSDQRLLPFTEVSLRLAIKVHGSHFVILDRQGVSEVDTPEVSVSVCICGNVCFQVYLHMNVCQRERCGLSYALLIVACWLRIALIAV